MDRSGADESSRRPWHEGPQGDAPAESWLGFDDDELLHRIEAVGPQHGEDARLLEVVASDRHFFIRQEAAKRVRYKKLLFPYEDDRHIGQILVRHMNRREDLTYLERLVARGTHGEVRKAAQVQLARLRKRISDQDRRESTVRADGTAWRISVVHADPALRESVARTLPSATYAVSGFDSGGAAVAAIKAEAPHLLLAGINELLGAGLYAAVRNRELPLPVVVLCDVSAAARVVEVVGKGADDFMLLPLQPGLLAAKVQALLHLKHVAGRRGERRKATGPIGEEGVLPLLRLCEEEQLTCRLVVATDSARYFADFVHGEMTEAGGAPAIEDDDALAAILLVRAGTYEMIEASSDDDKAEAASPAPPAVTASAPAAPSSAPGPASPWSAADVDATLLGWAVHFIVEQTWAHLGTAATAGLLRRTLQEGAARHSVLKVFTVEENAHVGVDLTQGARLPAEAVALTAQWMAALLAAARRIAPAVADIDVRQVTRIVGGALEQVDFYAAYDHAAAEVLKAPRPPSHVIGRIDLKRRG
jgi:FixJ family two-component response regulator